MDIDGILIKNGKMEEYKWNSKLKKRVKKPVTHLFTILSKNVEFDKTLTIEGFFKSLEKHVKEINLIFYSHLGGFDFQDYINDVKSKPSDKDYSQMKRCEVGWACDTMLDDEIHIYVDFGGIGIPDKQDIENGFKNEVPYSLSLSPISSYKKSPLVLDKTLHIQKWKQIKGNKTKLETVLKRNKPFTFIEAVGGILYEISFHGSSKSKVDFANSLNEIGKEIKKSLDETSQKKPNKSKVIKKTKKK